MKQLERMRDLASWYRGIQNLQESTNTGTAHVWNDLWESRDPRLIPIENDGTSQLAIFGIERYKKAQPLFNPQTMIEVGCGPASRSIQLAKKYGLSLSLLDNSIASLLLQARPLAIKSEYQNKTRFIQGDMLRYPFPDDSFDISFAYGPHDHFFGTQRQRAFDEMQRITAKSGIGIVIVPSQLNPFWTLEMIQKVWQDTWDFGPTKFFTPFELVSRMKVAGYKNVELFGASFFTSWLRLLPREKQVKRYDHPTSNKTLNQWLLAKNIDFKSFLNRYCGGDMMVIGTK